MRFLRFSPFTWLIFLLFLATAAVFFLQTEGVYTDYIRPALEPGQKAPVSDQVRQVIVRDDRNVLQAENTLLKPAGEAVENAGRKPEDAAVKASEKKAQARKAADTSPTVDPGKILSHNFSRTGDDFRAVFMTDRAVPAPKVFFIPSPARWVVDIPGIWRNTARFSNSIEEGFISRVVIGEHEDYLRVVFHFRDTGLTRPKPPDVINEKGGFIILLPVSE